MEIYATENESDMIALQQECFEFGLAVYSSAEYGRTVVDGKLIGVDADGNDDPASKGTSAWQTIKHDAGIDKFYIISATEFDYSEPRQAVLLAIVNKYPNVEIIQDFEPVVPDEL